MSQAKVKRFGRRKARPGQLLVYYGKLPHDTPDVVFSWGGSGASKCDSSLVYSVLLGKRCRVDFENPAAPFGVAYDPSLIEELEARGYDITTLRFSIEKKPETGGATP